MKKQLYIILTIIISICIFTACDESSIDETSASEPGSVEASAPISSDDPETTEPPHEHAWSAWTVTLNATCTTEGTEERTCDCGEKETQTIAPIDHTIIIDEAIPATCLSEGKTEGKHCAVCNTVIVSQTAIAISDHTIIIDEATPATCISDGMTEGSHCAVCNIILSEQTVIPRLLDCPIEYEESVEPTCTEQGYHGKIYCPRCDIVLVEHTVREALGHKEGDWVYTKTDTEAIRVTYCVVCNTNLSSESLGALAPQAEADSVWKEFNEFAEFLQYCEYMEREDEFSHYDFIRIAGEFVEIAPRILDKNGVTVNYCLYYSESYVFPKYWWVHKYQLKQPTFRKGYYFNVKFNAIEKESTIEYNLEFCTSAESLDALMSAYKVPYLYVDTELIWKKIDIGQDLYASHYKKYVYPNFVIDKNLIYSSTSEQLDALIKFLNEIDDINLSGKEPDGRNLYNK